MSIAYFGGPRYAQVIVTIKSDRLTIPFGQLCHSLGQRQETPSFQEPALAGRLLEKECPQAILTLSHDRVGDRLAFLLGDLVRSRNLPQNIRRNCFSRLC